MPLDHNTLFLAKKTTVSPSPWTERNLEKVRDGLTLISPLDINGVTAEGLRLCMTARKRAPDEIVTFKLECRGERGGAWGSICRLDWRPGHTHNNRGAGPRELQHLPQPDTHHHRFQLNWDWMASAVRRGNLPLAEPVTTTLDTWSDLLAFVGQEFRITSMAAVPQPPWEPDLF